MKGKAEELLYKLLERKHCVGELPASEKQAQLDKVDFTALASEWNALLIDAYVRELEYIT